MEKPKCKLCGKRHWSREGCKVREETVEYVRRATSRLDPVPSEVEITRVAAKVEKALNPDATRLGRLGGLGRAKKLSSERRKEIARGAARARWGVGRDREENT